MTFELPQNTRQIHGGTEGSHVNHADNFQMFAIARSACVWPTALKLACCVT